MHLGVRSVHPESLGSLGFTLGVVGFIRGCSVNLGSPWCLWVHPGSFGNSGSPWGSLSSSGVDWVHLSFSWG